MSYEPHAKYAMCKYRLLVANLVRLTILVRVRQVYEITRNVFKRKNEKDEEEGACNTASANVSHSSRFVTVTRRAHGYIGAVA